MYLGLGLRLTSRGSGVSVDNSGVLALTGVGGATYAGSGTVTALNEGVLALTGVGGAAYAGSGTVTGQNEGVLALTGVGGATYAGAGTVTPAAAALTTTSGIIAAALAATPGDPILVADSWFTAEGLDKFQTISGDKSVKVVGATDFVAESPTLPASVDLQVNVQVPHTKSDTTVVSSRGHVTLQDDAFWGRREEIFFGPEFTFPDNDPPFDYVATVAKGIKMWDEATGALAAPVYYRNSLRHNANHDGHIIWIAEFDDGTFTYINEGYMREGNGCWPGDDRIKADGAVHMAKLITLEVDPFSFDAASLNPARWPLETKVLRSSVTADATVSTYTQLMDEIVSAITIGAFAGDYIIECADGVYDDGTGIFDFRADAVTALDGLSGGRRICIVGTPGDTIFPISVFDSAPKNVDFRWVSFIKVAQAPTAMATRSMISISAGADVGFYGCYVDGVDAAQRVAFEVFSSAVEQTTVKIYDCVVTGCRNFFFGGSSEVENALLDVVVARNFAECGSDRYRTYSGNFLIEKNVTIGGGAWFLPNGQYQHPDLTQASFNVLDTISYSACFAYNFDDLGPAMTGPDDWRVAIMQFSYMNNADFGIYTFIGNIAQQTTDTVRGLDYGYTQSGWVEMSRNIAVQRAELI